MPNNGGRVIAASVVVLAGAVLLGFNGVALRNLDALGGMGLACVLVGGALFVLEFATSWYADWHQIRRRGRVSELEREEARV